MDLSNSNIGHKSFNARYVGFEDVARSFVPNHQFRELIKPESSIIVGPRGCGKTTLLKMLHPRAYYATITDEVKSLYGEMDFWGVYIPADIQWTTLLRILKNKETNSFSIDKVVGTLISINVLSSICDCFKSLIEISSKEASLSGHNEGLSEYDIQTMELKLAQDLKDIWEINYDKPVTLYSIQQYWNKVVRILNMSIENDDDFEWILSRYNGFLDYAHAAFESFRENCKQLPICALKNFKWALCFDELELAPYELRSNIYSLLRSSRYQEIIFKTTASFLVNRPNDSETDAAEGHDYQVILNWVHDKGSEKQWESFCDELYSQSKEKDVIEAIGSYDLIRCFEGTEENFRQIETPSDYSEGSQTNQLYIKLANVDKSFASFLGERGIDPCNPIAKDQKQYNLLKKIKTTAICRYYCSKPRMNIPFYFGKEILCDFSEGNPRLAIRIMNKMISSYVENGNLEIRTQSLIFRDLAEDMMRFYEHYPNAEVDILPSKKYSLGKLLKSIGDFFRSNLYVEPFSDVSKNTFYIDSQVPSKIIDLVNTGIELGAIMKVDSPDEKNYVYKLAYVLYPYFSLPRRLLTTKPEKLSSILDKDIKDNQLNIAFQDDNK